MDNKQIAEIKTLAYLAGRIQLLCEGFDDTNKNAVMTTKFKILLELSFADKLTPVALKNSVGLAKSNVAGICNKLLADGLIEKIKDSFDNRAIFYAITEKGRQELESQLEKMNKNIRGELAYKNNFDKIAKTATELLQLVK